MTATAAFTRADAWLLAAIAEHWPRGSVQKLQEFVHDCDFLNRSIPTFDEVSYGLERLRAAGYVLVERMPGHILRLRAAPMATDLANRMTRPAKALGDVLLAFEQALGCAHNRAPEAEDRTLGRLPGFEQAEWEAAISAYGDWFKQTAKEMLGVSLDEND